MSYKIIQCEIKPKESYKIMRNCSGCGEKANYINTNCFRVNANGNKIDVWLIYQCETCKHTYNLSIYERVKPSDIQADIYKKFLDNNIELAIQYGNDKQLFARNKADIDWNQVQYKVEVTSGTITEQLECIEIYNPYEIKLRTDKVVAELLNITRNKLKMLIKNKSIEFPHNYLGQTSRIVVKDVVF